MRARGCPSQKMHRFSRKDISLLEQVTRTLLWNIRTYLSSFLLSPRNASSVDTTGGSQNVLYIFFMYGKKNNLTKYTASQPTTRLALSGHQLFLWSAADFEALKLWKGRPCSHKCMSNHQKLSGTLIFLFFRFVLLIFAKKNDNQSWAITTDIFFDESVRVWTNSYWDARICSKVLCPAQ